MEPKRWIPLLITIILLGYLFKLPDLIAFSTMLMVVILLANIWKKYALYNIFYRRTPFYKRAFPGELITLRLEIENRKLLPISWVRVQDPWPKAVGPQDNEVLAPSHISDQGILTNIYSLGWFERIRRTYTLNFRKRGIYQVGPALMESGDLFGLYEHSKEASPTELLTVFPSLVPFEALQLPADDPYGDRRSRRCLYEDINLPIGVRDYHPEDSFRYVHWRATAHTGDLKVKQFQPVSAKVLVLCLNVATFAHPWEGTSSEMLEHLVNLSATLINHGIQSGYRVGLISNGCLAHADQPFRIPPGRSPKQLAILLEALAGVSAVYTASFERFLTREMPKVPYGATLLIVTAVTTPELAEVLLQLKKHNRRITLFSIAQQPPPQLLGIRIVHMPFANHDALRVEGKSY